MLSALTVHPPASDAPPSAFSTDPPAHNLSVPGEYGLASVIRAYGDGAGHEVDIVGALYISPPGDSMATDRF